MAPNCSVICPSSSIAAPSKTVMESGPPKSAPTNSPSAARETLVCSVMWRSSIPPRRLGVSKFFVQGAEQVLRDVGDDAAGGIDRRGAHLL